MLGFGVYWPSRAPEHLCFAGLGVGAIGGEHICTDFKREFNTDPDMLATWNYDALNLLVNAIRTAGEDRAKIREAILATKGYPGVIGTFNFSPDGEGLRAAFAATIQNGEAKLIKPITLD